MSRYPRSLEVRGDYSSSGIWVLQAAGLLRKQMISHQDLELPDELASRFREWLKRHDLHGRKSGFDNGTFDAIGLTLSKDLQRFLGAPTKVGYSACGPEHGRMGLAVFRWLASKFRRRP